MSIKNSEIQLISQRLVELHCKVNETYQVNLENPIINLNVKVNTSFEITEVNKTASIKLFIILFENIENAPFRIDGVMQGIFNYGDNLEIDKIKSILAINGAAILYSYFRPIVSQYTTFTGYPPIILPILNFTEAEISERK